MNKLFSPFSPYFFEDDLDSDYFISFYYYTECRLSFAITRKELPRHEEALFALSLLLSSVH